MGLKFRFTKRYILWASALLALEALIALFLHDKVIRPYVGDVLAPVFLYCLVRGGLAVSVRRAAMAVLLISYLIEWLQYVHLLARLGWAHYRPVAILLGSHFEWADLLAYTAGVALILLAEHWRQARHPARNDWSRPAG